MKQPASDFNGEFLQQEADRLKQEKGVRERAFREGSVMAPIHVALGTEQRRKRLREQNHTLLSVHNRTVNLDHFDVNEPNVLLQLGKAWVENAPANARGDPDRHIDEKTLPRPLRKGEEDEVAQRIAKPTQKGLESSEQLRALSEVPACVLLACHVASFKRQRRYLQKARLRQYTRYKERLRVLNLAIPRQGHQSKDLGKKSINAGL